jgi:hypothetical protein
MLSKCANPSCNRHFLYLHEGKLFRVERELNGDNGPGFDTETPIRRVRQLEFFWLCSECAFSLTVRKEGKNVRVGPREGESAAA